jgi:hypothetical protein
VVVVFFAVAVTEEGRAWRAIKASTDVRPRDILGSNIDPGICHFLTSVEVKSTDYKISG